MPPSTKIRRDSHFGSDLQGHVCGLIRRAKGADSPPPPPPVRTVFRRGGNRGRATKSGVLVRTGLLGWSRISIRPRPFLAPEKGERNTPFRIGLPLTCAAVGFTLMG